MKRIVSLFIAGLLLSNISIAASLPSGIGNYFIGYQGGLDTEMKRFDMSITDVRNYMSSQVASVKSAGTKVIGYVSVGESVQLEVGDGKGPGGYASWYFDKNGDNKPDVNPAYNSYYTNAANPLWQDKVVNVLAKEAFNKGSDGIFLDTVETISVYPESSTGMVDLIKKLRQAYPGKIIVQNWGFNIAEQTAPYINAVMWESWYPDLNDAWVTNWQNKFIQLKKTTGLDVITLGYYDKYQNLDRYYQVSKDLGFIPYVQSDSSINTMVDYFSQRRMNINPTPTPTPTVTPVSVKTYPMVYMTPYVPKTYAMLVGPTGNTSGWSVTKAYNGTYIKEARGWDAGVEFTIADTTRDTQIGINYIDDVKYNKLGISYYAYNGTSVVWTTKAVVKQGTNAVTNYTFTIPKQAYKDNNPSKPGIQVLVGIGGLCPVDRIYSVTLR